MLAPEMAEWLFGQQPGERSPQLNPRVHIKGVQDHCRGPSMQNWQRVVEQGEIYLLTVAWPPFPKVAEGQRGQSLKSKKRLHRVSNCIIVHKAELL